MAGTRASRNFPHVTKERSALQKFALLTLRAFGRGLGMAIALTFILLLYKCVHG